MYHKTDIHLRKIGDVAGFFNRSVMWVRACETEGLFRYKNGAKIEPIRKQSENTGLLGTRYYTLDLIEEMAESLYRFRRINKFTRERVLNAINAHRMIEERLQ